MLAGRYDCVVANPPYMGPKSMPHLLRELARQQYERSNPMFTQCLSSETSPSFKIMAMLA